MNNGNKKMKTDKRKGYGIIRTLGLILVTAAVMNVSCAAFAEDPPYYYDGYDADTGGAWVQPEPEDEWTDTSWTPGYDGATGAGYEDPAYPGYTDGTVIRLPELPEYGEAAYISEPYIYYEYIKPQCGPGEYFQVFRSMNGKKHLYRPDEITRADIYFTVGNYAYVGFGYSDGKWRCGFFPADVFVPYGGWEAIPQYSLDEEMYGTVNQTVTPYNGPDWNSGEYESCMLYYGDAVYACMESNGWYLCRFYNNHDNFYGDIYLWVPGNAISF